MRRVGEGRERDVRRIRVIKDGPVGEIRLNEPEVLTAQGKHWPEDMLAAAEEVREDPEIRVVILTGEGRSFCSGLNLTQLGRGEIPKEWFRASERAFRSMETMEKPVIASLQGSCIGGGVQVAMGLTVTVELRAQRTITRSEGKDVRVIDERTGDGNGRGSINRLREGRLS